MGGLNIVGVSGSAMELFCLKKKKKDHLRVCALDKAAGCAGRGSLNRGLAM